MYTANYVLASNYAQSSDWCVQVMAADSAYSTKPIEIWVDNNVNMGSCGTTIALSANHVLRFIQGGTYALGIYGMQPAGNSAAVICSDWGTILSYTGTGWAYDVISQSDTDMENCQLNITGSAQGGARFQNHNSHAYSNGTMRRVFINSPNYTANPARVGVLLLTSENSDQNYLNHIDVQTTDLYYGVELQSTVSANSSNANWISVACQGHTVCVYIASGTDNWISGTADNAYSGTGATGILCGGGAYACSTNHLGPFTSEQGGNSTTISFVPGAEVNYFDVMSNDATNVSDTSGVSTNRGNNSGLAHNRGLADLASASHCNAGGTLAVTACEVVYIGTTMHYIPVF